MSKNESTSARVRWGRLRFSIIGPLLASPAEPGELAARLDELAMKTYAHPSTGGRVRFARSTIERWYYAAKNEPRDPLRALERKVHGRAGSHPSIGPTLALAIRAQHRAHPRWSYQLHVDNLRALARIDVSVGLVPSRMTLSRYMRSQGLVRSKAKRNAEVLGEAFVAREVRSFEVSHVGGLWHLDFHVGSRRVVGADGTYSQVHLFGMLDDRSRLGCHLQWYPSESAETLVHGLCQGIQKRGLPRALLTDNGKAMLAAETTEGLARHSVVHHTTLPYSRVSPSHAKPSSFLAQTIQLLMVRRLVYSRRKVFIMKLEIALGSAVLLALTGCSSTTTGAGTGTGSGTGTAHSSGTGTGQSSGSGSGASSGSGSGSGMGSGSGSDAGSGMDSGSGSDAGSGMDSGSGSGSSSGSGSDAGSGDAAGVTEAGTHFCGTLHNALALACGQDTPSWVAVANGNVYWTNYAASGSIMSVSEMGGTPTTIASGQTYPWAIAVDATNVYWTNYGDATAPTAYGTAPTAANGAIMQQALAGGTATTLVALQEGPWGIATDASNIYWTTISTGMSNGKVKRVAIGGTTAVTLATGFEFPGGITVDATNVYWANMGGGFVDSTAKAGTGTGAVKQLITMGTDFPTGVAVQGANLYVSNWAGSGFIETVPIAGGTAVTVAGTVNQSEPIGIAVDSANVYWANNDNPGTVASVPLAGGTVTTLTSGHNSPTGIAVDATGVYFAATGGGRIWKVALP